MIISKRVLGGAVALSMLANLIGPLSASAATQVDLAGATNFAVLAGSFIDDAVPTGVITGHVGLSPASGTFITGLTSPQVSGTIYAPDAAGPDGASGNDPVFVGAAKSALTAAYLDAAGQGPATALPGGDNQLGGLVLTPGTYSFGAAATANLIGTVTLDAEGDPNAIFIFQASSSFVTDSAATVSLINSAQACHVFWQVTSSATLGTGTNLEGSILALTSITDNGGSTVNGRLLARNASVSLNNTDITVPTCVAAPQSGPSASTGTISVVKLVINDNGGTRAISDFPLFVNDVEVVSGETNAFVANPSIYQVSETNTSGYTQSFSGDCDAAGQMVLQGSQNQLCIITNDDIGAPVVVPPVPPLIDVVKMPSPLALPDGPGSVNYTYTVRNIGTVPMTNVTLVGDTCSPISRISGDTDSDSQLDVTETWVYTCPWFLTATHTNTVVATGMANGLMATDIASAIVVVGTPIVPPLIHITKVPSPLTLLAGGGAVTYNYTVTNPGTEPLENVFVTDDKCTGLPGRVVGHPGDLNDNNLLENNEAWSFTCISNLTATTTNVGTASGEANGLTATDFAVATVVVAAAAGLPTLPPAGTAPFEHVPVVPIVATCLGSIALVLLVARKQRHEIKR